MQTLRPLSSGELALKLSPVMEQTTSSFKKKGRLFKRGTLSYRILVVSIILALLGVSIVMPIGLSNNMIAMWVTLGILLAAYIGLIVYFCIYDYRKYPQWWKTTFDFSNKNQ